jgi:DNA polymerase-3 subunit epsilon
VIDKHLLPGASGVPFVAIDFETADRFRDSACSVAIVRVENECRVDQRATLLRPPRPSEDFTHIHGITLEAQNAAPLLADVWPTLLPLFDGVAFIVAHNASFDLSVMRATWAAAGLAMPSLPWGCTVDMARRLWPQSPDHKLDTLCRRFRIPLKHHDALSDAEACARLVIGARAQARRKAAAEAPPPAEAPQGIVRPATSAPDLLRPLPVATAQVGPLVELHRAAAPGRPERLRYLCRVCDVEEFYTGYSQAQARALVLPKHAACAAALGREEAA